MQRESTEYLIRRPDKGLKIGETEKIRLTVKFNTLEPAPRLVGYRLNARVVCPVNGILDKTQPITAPPPVVDSSFPSPCPDILTYEPMNDTDKWFAVVKIKPTEPLTGVWLRIILDRESIQLGVSDEVSTTICHLFLLFFCFSLLQAIFVFHSYVTHENSQLVCTKGATK